MTLLLELLSVELAAKLINEPFIGYCGMSEFDSTFLVSWQDRVLPFYGKHEWNELYGGIKV